MASSSKNIRSPSPTGSVRSSAQNPTPSSYGTTSVVRDDKDGLRVEAYHGDRAGLGRFIAQLTAFFKLKHHTYPRHEDKVLYAALNMKSSAFNWIEPIMMDHMTSPEGQKDEETKEIFSSFPVFIDKLKQLFGTPGEEQAASQRIHHLKQTHSVAQYYALFKRFQVKLDWQPNAFSAAFYNGLKDNVKYELGIDRPTEYHELVDRAIEIDKWLQERRLEKSGFQTRAYYTGQSSYSRPQRQSYGDPMDIDLMHQRPGPGRSQGQRGRGRGGYHGQRGERQKKENLCYNCGKPGHYKRDCKSPIENTLHMMVQECSTAGSEEKKADTSEKTQAMTGSQGTTAQEGYQEPEVFRKPGIPVEERSKRFFHSLFEQNEETPPPETEIPTGTADQEWTHGALETIEEGSPPPKATTALVKACQRTTTPINFATRWEDLGKAIKHATLSCTACYDDSCAIHYSDKSGTGWFPQRPKHKNRNNRKSKGAQESLAQTGDLPNNGNDLKGNEFWMMNADPIEEEVKYVVTSMDEHRLFMVTPYWEEYECWFEECPFQNIQGHRHPAFVEGTTAKHPATVRLDFCTATGCTITGQHAHQGQGPMLPIKPPTIWDFSMVTKEESEGSEEEVSEPEEEHQCLPWGPHDDQHDRSTHTLVYTDEYVEVITNRWTTWVCDSNECHPTQHQHVAYDSEEPRSYMKKIKLWICWDLECEDHDDFHGHQAGEPGVVPLNLRKEAQDRIRQQRGERLAKEAYGTKVISETIPGGYVAGMFVCADAKCGYKETRHQHYCLIDPRHPHLAIQAKAYIKMLQDGLKCENTECPWTKKPHVHFPEKSLDMMVGSKYHPDIVENVVDERTNEEAIANYFECDRSWRCEERDNPHSHLCHVDPKHPAVAIPPERFPTLEECGYEGCDFEDWTHVHWPKNL
jgi:hypothetical protein